MNEANRLVCPACESVYRARNFTPGKKYKCRKCGAPLREMEPGAIAIHDNPLVNNEGARALDFEAGIANENLAAMSSTRRVAGGGREAPSQALEAFARLESRMARMFELMEALPAAASDSGADLLRDEMRTLLNEAGAKFAELGRKIEGDMSSLVAERMKEAGDTLLSRLEERRAALGEAADAPGPAAEIDVQDLANRLVAGIRSETTPLDYEGEAGVQALARVAEELVREQSVNSARLTALAEETRRALAAFAKFEEWRGDLPVQVADEIGRTVEERVVGPVSGALARQAPAILSDLRDDKLLDVVSRSVREAQRPLLREILAGGRGGVPLWLFASILLPLLLILGYLFLPGEFGAGDGSSAAAVESLAENVRRLEAEGVALTPDAEERLLNVEAVVLDMHAQALTHARNAGALEDEVKSLRGTLAERDALLKEYGETLEKQVRRLRAYEMTLTRLGVPPESVQE